MIVNPVADVLLTSHLIGSSDDTSTFSAVAEGVMTNSNSCSTLFIIWHKWEIYSRPFTRACTFSISGASSSGSGTSIMFLISRPSFSGVLNNFSSSPGNCSLNESSVSSEYSTICHSPSAFIIIRPEVSVSGTILHSYLTAIRTSPGCRETFKALLYILACISSFI